ncbi:hypothetical protein [Saccharopolyspora pogona]|uniref:hypothetical protein n=1 Tax=Saccharopolyspora pogona TaxID=333966 RepID=UPI001CC258FE|nr:hypothetical protein [Saccharopolyspora pogona]
MTPLSREIAAPGTWSATPLVEVREWFRVLWRPKALTVLERRDWSLPTVHIGHRGLPLRAARGCLLHGQWLRRDRRPAEARAELSISIDLFDSLGHGNGRSGPAAS